MQDFMNTLMLICAGIAALELGVVVAYLACKAGFALLKMQPRPASSLQAAKVQVARIN
jgi:uncharacterized membrane protein (DUF441 family)